MKIFRPEKSKENLQFAVYGGICGILGLLTLIILFIGVLQCKPAILNAIGISIISSALAILTIHFGNRSNEYKEGKIVMILGGIIIVLVGVLYIIGIIPCVLS